MFVLVSVTLLVFVLVTECRMLVCVCQSLLVSLLVFVERCVFVLVSVTVLVFVERRVFVLVSVTLLVFRDRRFVLVSLC